MKFNAPLDVKTLLSTITQQSNGYSNLLGKTLQKQTGGYSTENTHTAVNKVIKHITAFTFSE